MRQACPGQRIHAWGHVDGWIVVYSFKLFQNNVIYSPSDFRNCARINFSIKLQPGAYELPEQLIFIATHKFFQDAIASRFEQFYQCVLLYKKTFYNKEIIIIINFLTIIIIIAFAFSIVNNQQYCTNMQSKL